ncbi:MAG: long-chain fatty acid--CoA ligase [Thermoanaerobaculia bacterium]|jgi:long-subunit acyl-CoA synthetase (AMP-forming)|nr:long-chain fatty acid--CoA ligase [Thermoanaerobaculia bacterium]MBP9823320.1 long-chain fatty acid--CoA ligase [Thermoanaerobaculia bacterium]
MKTAPETTVIAALERAAREFGERPAQAHRTADGWVTTSWRDYCDQIFCAAAGFVELGVVPGTGLAILSANRPEWAIADLAAIAAGAIPTGIFVTNTPEQCAYVLDHTEATVAVADNSEALAKLLAARGGAPRLRTIVLFDEGEVETSAATAATAGHPEIVTWRRLLELGAAAGKKIVADRLAEQRPDDVATLIYTSGTTGSPKGVELTHRNLVWTAWCGAHETIRMNPEDRQLSYLPLAHIAEQMLTLHLPLQHGGCTFYVAALDRVPEALREVRPTIFFAVPRVWEKLQSAVEKASSEAPPLRRRLLSWARRKALAAGYAAQRGEAVGFGAALADRLVLGKVRAKLGLHRVRHAASAAAPISLGTLEFFLSLGVPIFEIYGLSETSGPGTISTPGRFRTGSVGPAMPGVEIRLAADGEIQMRGPNIFRGYRKDPQATASAIDADGWFHTGDIGELSQDGFLRITDRKKELLVTSGGKKIAPAPIENRLREIEGVAHAVLLGEQRNYVAALLTLDPTALPTLAGRLGSPARSIVDGARCPLLRAFFGSEIERVNGELARYESVRKFEVLPTEFTVDGGELTPTLKLKRKVVRQKFAARIEEIYSQGAG